MTLTRDELDPGQLVQKRVQGREYVLGKRSATLSFQMNLAPTGTAAVTGQSSITSPLGLLLKAIMGGQQLGAGTTATSGSTPIVINCTSGTPWESGYCMGWTNAAGVVEWREVKSRSSNAVTLHRGFSGSPATSDVLYNKATYYLTANPAESLAFIVEGLESDDRWLLTGGQAEGGFTMSFDLTGGQIPRVTFNLSFARWYDSTETGTPLTGSLGTATYSATETIVGEAGIYETWTVGSPTYATTQAVHVSALSFEPQIAFARYTSPSGINTVKQWVASRTPIPVKGSFTTGYEAATWWTRRNSKTDIAQQYVFGTTGAASVVLSAPCTQILNPQRAADASALAAQTIMWNGRMDSDTVATTDVALSPVRIHL